MRKALSEVVASFISILVTLSLMGIFLAYNANYLLPSTNTIQSPSVHLISVLWTYGNCVYVENYGSTPVTVAYAIVGTSTTPAAVSVSTINNQPVPNNLLEPGQVYKLQIQIPGQAQVPVTFFTTDGTFFEVIL
ncbi:hypothetical protein [Metallosphaera hakonensis]|uniref:Uncharacterized protein n=1 Tax=Metallosphaera hakonensis JCM 8857 = DSM 7519 TaxID=1293036 RepID=A0A2U9IWI7_9CREN|nr:hypothetical protein [Metallosphaera hakonensis]AWS00420.1 hypothetical protein DFR87_12870 [Metallosphaera hakonensis JCM 8857 = DSM 7519]